MKKYFLLPIVMLLFLVSCDTEKQTPQTIKKESINGFVQKGPFVSGTSILMNELNSELVQTGKIFTSTITNDMGLFELNNIELNSRFVEFTSSGFYFNEVSGEISNSQITLTTLSDIEDRNSINVNVLTHLEKRRVQTLMKEGKSFSESKKQSRDELLSVFSMSLNNDSSFEEFDISKNTEEGGILLAISIILQGNRTVGQLTELLSKIQNDFSDNGVLDDDDIMESLWITPLKLDFVKIRENIENRFEQLNINSSVPNFEKFIGDFESSFPQNSNFYLAENGVTCMCPNSKAGEFGVINGKIYESVDNELLRKRRSEINNSGEMIDLTRLCTSLVTDMSRMFELYSFNQPIGNWDVSNVTTMYYMFWMSRFNQPIGSWNVSKVNNMSGMFYGNNSFNHHIEEWDVSNVTNMSDMFGLSVFNQPIGKWDVSNVRDMSGMFAGLLSITPFNQPIGQWDVSNVTKMNNMFRYSEFNHPIGSWNVSTVTEMNSMFEYSQFNQNLSSWCVNNILSEPGNFSNFSPLTEENKPIWGTCPN